MTTDRDEARDQAQAQLENIREMVTALRKAREAGDRDAIEKAEEAISEHPLEIALRSGWVRLGYKRGPMEPAEFKILLCTGGPAVRLTGTLDEDGYPESILLEYRDWFRPWTEYTLSTEEEADCLEYARQFNYDPA